MDRIEDIIEDMRQGRMVILMDDEDRENEGDIVMAAEFVRPEDINFMARYARGLICLTLTRDRCRQLRLPLMVNDNAAAHGTNFTVSIEAAEGVTTGISAHDRARTVRVAVEPEARPEDVVQPGHIFPLMAEPGGVLARAGHTEAGCDLARLAGCKEAAAVIVEVLNEDGTMARRPDLEKFAAEHGIKLGTIADLIRYRLQNEHSVERVCESVVNTRHGAFKLVAYEDSVDNTVHMALVKGDIDPERPTLVRVHLRNTLSDVLGIQHEDFGWPLDNALKTVAEAGEGVVVVLRKWETPQALVKNIMHLSASEPVTDEEEVADLRTYGIGAQILMDLNVRKMRVLSAPKRMHAISGFDLEVAEYVQTD
ncbi:3,4-dihydroxy-2-butanone 4-phosphate synthase [Oceanococcus atlanticus]|uniref:3,4-dihydroxy-2-butanone 4-phosphate synthase n=1 Tax=Oceanococcus atlanticus TaxID=1317117 RepID=A0A1Y1SD96_9GAMM|nr:bifunctional 3,4-dihydroxy-2-butanone-4-phosphate synthase/GTP cyclohydrolase II [Oceanococcus atlanticus]ORE86316.1 3,4-dihydroxy-2-butanone 4-phosphate synthase [Oceanococcus atlanticus]RZO83413.1 MAG: 3,4-dihydroxy-2-butanone-4-phosphate synthase [Oceanococcus sp.]